jgi:hypothetical protein
MSAVQFQRQLGLPRYETAFEILHKLRASMVCPDQNRIGENPAEHVEADETYVGSRTRGKGRGVHDMTLVANAVEVKQRKYRGSAQQAQDWALRWTCSARGDSRPKCKIVGWLHRARRYARYYHHYR